MHLTLIADSNAFSRFLLLIFTTKIFEKIKSYLIIERRFVGFVAKKRAIFIENF